MKDVVQEQLIELRRKQILDAAAKVFAAKGYHPTTIQDIAKEAGIAHGTIYHYFEHKTALLFGILDVLTANAQAEAGQLDVAGLDLRAFLTMYLRLPLNALRTDNFGLFRILISEIMVNAELRNEFYQRFHEPTLQAARPLLEKWAAEQLTRPLDVDLTLRTISGLMMGMVVTHLMGDATLSTRWDELPEFIADLILEGLRNNQQ